MSPPNAPSRDLLFGLLALQNGLINQVQLVAAFQAWTLDKTRALADHLIALGHLNGTQKAVVEAMAELHLAKHGDVERSLAAISAGRSTHESLARLGDPDIEGTLAHVRPRSTQQDGGADADRTASYSVGSATSDGLRFRVLRPHARGGLGAVFVALDHELHREVALKQILDHHADDPVSRQRFLLEAEVTGGLEHPGIVPVYGLGTYGDGRPYYAMRFIRGDSLKEAIDRFHTDDAPGREPGRQALELRKLLRRFLDVCNAIEYAHTRGVLHRDIKPGNIIVGKHGETLVVDWGLAKVRGRAGDGIPDERPLALNSASGSAETLPGSALGTPAYMSPEQARGDVADLGPLSDVYSLGATLYCLLTGHPPVEADDVGAVLRAVQKGEIRPPRQLDPAIDRALEAVCLKAMARSPDHRYGSCRALADDVERWMADEPVTAWREPWIRRASRWVTRHRTGVAAAGTALLAGVVGLGAVLGVQTQANARLTEANIELGLANARELRANADLKEANERERQRFDLAMDAIKLFHGEISKDLLLKQRQFEKLRVKLLRGAADFYGKLEGLLKGRQDRQSRAALGRAYEELGELTIVIGHSADALAVFRKAIQVRRALVQESSGDDRIKLDLARNLRSAGFLLEGISDRPAAKASYEEALALARDLKPTDDMSEPPFRVDAKITHSIGWLHHAMGQEDAAVEWLRKAAEILDRGIATGSRSTDPAGDKDSQLFLVNTLNALSGPLGAVGRVAESLEDQQRALRVVRELAKRFPNDHEVLNGHASTYFNMGGLYRSMSWQIEGLSAFRTGLEVLDKLVAEYPAIVEYRRFQARCLNGCGDMLEGIGRPEEALACFRPALEAWQKVVDDNPGRYAEPIELGSTYNRIGWLLFGMGRMTEAVEQYEAARAVFQKLLDRFPPHLLHRTRSELSNVLINIAEIQRRQGRLSEARANCDGAIAMRDAVVREFPEVLGYRVRIGECWLRFGQVRADAGESKGAVTAWRRAIASYEALSQRVGELAMFEAGCHAMLSRAAGMSGSGVSAPEGHSEAEKAMAILRQMVDLGYHDPQLTTESSLEPLHARADFHLLLMDVAFPAEPFSKVTDAEP
jgi:eukaryotic-like serine/threonine-protein kinase